MNIDHAVIEYYLWKSNNGGEDPKVLLARASSDEERRKLIKHMNDIDWLWQLTAPLRNAQKHN